MEEAGHRVDRAIPEEQQKKDMKTTGNCAAINAVGRSNGPMSGSDSSAACWFAMNIFSPPTGPSSISLASGSRCANVYETRSRHIHGRSGSLGPEAGYFVFSECIL
jgi:hypothetical protein